jgi:feruloyl-CoA synthase
MVPIAPWKVDITRDDDGVIRVTPCTPLGAYPAKLTEKLDQYAFEAPDRIFLARRENGGDWRSLTYARFRQLSRNAAQWLLESGYGSGCPIAILSGNDLDHAVLGMAAMYAGIPYAPISPAYSLVSKDFGKLRRILELLKPVLVFAADGAVYGPAIKAVIPDTTALVVSANPPMNRRCAMFGELCAIEASGAVETASAAVNADTVAKILFTSGSTGVPKGVINTQRMLCSNQQMLQTVFPFLADTPPVICDWLPWNHTFGGNHNFGLVLYNGGTLYIDDGKPVGPAFRETVRNLREIAPTVYFNVPKGYEALVEHMRADASLRERFFSRLQMNFYAAASLSQHIWDDLDRLAVQTRGERIPMLTGLAATETAPFAICANTETARAGVVGLPVPGVEMKLVPADEKLEVRVRGPNVTPGFWNEAELTRLAFDEEGYYRLGDAVRFLDPADPARGFVFDGRIAEDFKLSTGTWVSVGPLRSRFILHAAPCVRDLIIAGHDRDEITALILPDPEHNPTDERIRELLRTFADQSTGSSTRIMRAIVLQEPPSIDTGELTDKGSINQQTVLKRRANLVDMLYESPPADLVISF